MTSDEKLVVRNPGLQWSEGYRRFWFRGSTFLTNSMNALSIVIPEGELFFIESVRHYLGEIRDPVLHAQALAFVGQEAAHGREHRRFNDLTESEGYPVRPIAERLRRHLKQRSASMPPSSRLAMTCALEHFTTILGAEFLRHPIFRESVSGEHARLWFWHAVEELEHKSVAFDVYTAIGGTYGERVGEMIRASVGFWTLWLSLTLAYQTHDGRLWSPREWWTAFIWLFVRPAYLLRLVPRYLAYYRPDFHPSLHEDENLILEWRARLALVPGGGLSADGERWISCRPGFFLPVRVLSRLFRRLFLAQLQGAFETGRLRFFNALEPLQAPGAFARYLAPVRQAEWVVYAKPPFGGPGTSLSISAATRIGLRSPTIA